MWGKCGKANASLFHQLHLFISSAKCLSLSLIRWTQHGTLHQHVQDGDSCTSVGLVTMYSLTVNTFELNYAWEELWELVSKRFTGGEFLNGIWNNDLGFWRVLAWEGPGWPGRLWAWWWLLLAAPAELATKGPEMHGASLWLAARDESPSPLHRSRSSKRLLAQLTTQQGIKSKQKRQKSY